MAQEKVPFSPTEPYRFCPADGTRLSEPRPSGGASCPHCGRSWYRSSSPAVGTVIVEDGRALVTVRAGEPEKGRLDLPGGFLEVGEHPTDGIVREVREELGVGSNSWATRSSRKFTPTARTEDTSCR